MQLTINLLMASTGARRAHAELYLPFIQGTLKAYNIDTPTRVADFLSQIGTESNRLATLEENLNYSVDGLLKNFGRHRISEVDARRLGRIDDMVRGRKVVVRPADQQAIANIIYGGEWGRKNLGNKSPGDGWKHRGMGLKQLTGLDNHTRCGKALGEDFVNHPERLLMPVNAALSAGWFWHVNNLNAVSDTRNLELLTERVNGGRNGIDTRRALRTAALSYLGATA